MLLNLNKRFSRRQVKGSTNKINRAVFENLENRRLLSGVVPTVSGYSTLVTEIQSTTGPVASTTAVVNGTVGTGSLANQSYAVIEFDPSNSTVFPGTTISAPTNLTLSLVNNLSAWNSRTGAVGTNAAGSFDVYLLPKYTAPDTLTYSTANQAGFALGLQGGGGFNGSGVVASSYFLGTFAAPAANGTFTVNLSLPTAGTANASTLLTTDLSTKKGFEIAITPHDATSVGAFAGSLNYTNDSGNTEAPNGIPADGELNEAPVLSYNSNATAETLNIPYPTISVNQDNSADVVEIDVERAGYAGDAASVNYTTTGITGVAGTDYGNAGNSAEVTGTVNFAAGQTVATISIPIQYTLTASDKTFSVSLQSPSSNATLSTSDVTTVTIVGTTQEADTIAGPVTDAANSAMNKAFVIGSAAPSIQPVKPVNATFAPVNGSFSNGSGDFGTPQYPVFSFNINLAQQGIAVPTAAALNNLSLELDNYNSAYNTFTDGTTIPSANPQQIGNFNVYLLTSPTTSTPTNALTYVGADPTSGGLNGAAGALLLGTASFSDQSTANSPRSSNLGLPEGVQDVYTLELSSAAQVALFQQLEPNTNPTTGASLGTLNTVAPIRLAVTAGSPAFAAEFADNNSAQGGNYGIQPYVWLNGTTVPAPLQAENFAINYSAIDVDSTKNVVEVDIARASTGLIGDSATINFTLADGTAHLGADYTAPSSESVTFAPGQTVATVAIPLIPQSNATAEKTFTITLTTGSTTGSEPQPVLNTTPTTITIVPAVVPTQTVTNTSNTDIETSGPYSSAYVNGGGNNGTGSFAYQGFFDIDFAASKFIQPGQQLSSLTDFSLGLSNYENESTSPNTNYGGPPGDFTLYIAGTNETDRTNGDPDANGVYNAADPVGVPDGIGGFQPATPGAVGPLIASNVAGKTGLYAIPIGVASFDTSLGEQYYTPTTEALNKVWSIPLPGGTIQESALQVIESEINAGQDIRIIAAPGNTNFHAYFYGSNNGPATPRLEVDDTVVTNLSSEAVSFGTPTVNVDDNGVTAVVSVTRSLLTGSTLGDTLTVNYATADGNAFAGSNYTAQSGTLTFAPGVSTQTISIPITDVANLNGDKAFTITLTSPQTSDTTHYVAPILGNSPTATVFITDNVDNAQTLTQYTTSVGDVGTGGPGVFGTPGALNPPNPINYSIAHNSRFTAMDFNDSSVINFDDPAEFNGPAGPLPGPYVGPTGNPQGTGPVVFTPQGDGTIYSSSVSAINEITMNFVNYYSTTPGAQFNVYLVSDAGTNILPGAAGTSKNPHYYDTSTTPDANGFIGAPDGVGNQFGTDYLLGTITNPSITNYTGYTEVPMTSFNATADSTLIGDLNNGTKFRIVVAPESTSGNADWIYNYVTANPGYAADTGNPVNYYIQPELSFDVSYLSTQGALPAYITPSANADYVWDSTTGNLTLTNGSLTFTSDGANDKTDLPVNLTATGPTAQVFFTSSQHLAGLTLSNGATAQVVSLGAARTHSNHSVLVIGTLGQVNDPAFSIDKTSSLDLADNDLIIHTGSSDANGYTELAAIQKLAATGRDGGLWTGLGLTSSAAAAQDNFDGLESVQLAVVDNTDLASPFSSWTVNGLNETLGGNDIIVKYTYTGDFNLQGKVDFSDTSILGLYYDNGASTGNEWAFGDTNGDGLLNFADVSAFGLAFGNGTPIGNDTTLL